MAMFKAFKPSGMEKIARAMGYSGNMQGFQDYLAQDPMRQHQMQTYQQKAMQMAKGGMVRKKYQEGGGVTKDGGLLGQPFQQNYQSAPMYEQFKQSDYYKNIPQIGAAVTGSSTIDGQTYNFPYASEASAYNNYMKSLGSYQVGSPLNPNAVPQQGVGKSSGTTMGGPLDGPLKFEQVAQPVSSSYGAGFRQPGDMGRYVAFNDPGQPGAGFANAAEYEAAQQQGNVLGMPYDPRFMDKFPRPTSTTDPRIIADGPGNLAQAQNQRLAPWLEGYDFFNPNKTLEERSAEIQRLEREYKAANPNWEQELRTMADDTPIPFVTPLPNMQQQTTTPAAYQPLPQPYTELPQQQTYTYDDAYIQTLIDQLGTAEAPGFDAQDYVRIGNTVYPSNIEAGKYLGAGQTVYGGNTAGGTGGGAYDVHPYRRFLNFDYMQSEGIQFYVKPGASGREVELGLSQSVPELVVGPNRYDLKSDRAQNYLKQYELWKRQKAARKSAAQKASTTDAQQQGNVPGSRIPFTSGLSLPAGGIYNDNLIDPYQQYRQNVERFSETGTFKNPNIQIKFDAMTEALKQDDSDDPFGTKKTQAITDYIKTIYTGPITLADTGATGLGANELTPEFQQFARNVGITIKQGLAADGPKVFELAAGSPIATIPGYLPPAPSGPSVADVTIGQMYQPALPEGAVTQAAATPLAQEQMIDPRTGTVTGAVSVPTTVAGTAMAVPAQEQQAAQMQAAQVAPAVDSALASTQAAQGTIDPRAEVIAAQQTASSVGNVTAAQGQAVLIDNPVQREIQAGELISGAAADANKAAQFTEQVQAAEATPSTQATVQGQLAQLTANFDANNPPAWAAGALRNATAQMAARGLGASSLAGQAIIQATMESALPIAQADASIFATFEQQNLTNRQQRAMLAAQQRAQFMGQEFDQAFQARVANAAKISDIANQNFTAEQQVQLENSRAANTMNLNNLSNKQALIMSEAAALAQLDTQNLSNRQQAAVQNAQNFLQMDMQNLSNKQQTEMFKAQQRTQALFNDQAATNAAAQFNATSENQVNQFFANLASQVSQFNATQANAQAQFNAGQVNTVERFNAELNNQRDQFNATNQLAIAQSNAVWRREIATADTAAVNRANELNANAILDMSKTAYDNLWTYYADTMEWAWESAESELERLNNLAIANLDADAASAASRAASSSAAGSALGNLIGTLGSAWIRWCWVAREVYGPENTDWLVFRDWMLNKAPNWLRNLYGKYGESFASYISNKPKLKKVIKFAMNKVVKKHKKEYTNYVK